MLEHINTHILNKKNLLLRPGATRRISFRGTPGGNVSVRIFTKRGPNLGDTEEPVTPENPAPDNPFLAPFSAILSTAFRTLSKRNSKSCTTLPHKTSPTKTSPYEKIRAIKAFNTSDVLAPSSEKNREEIGISLLDNAPFRRPRLSLDNINDLVVLPPTLPPVIIQHPMRVRFKVRDGVTFHDETTQPTGNGHPGRITVSSNHSFIGHDIIDVLFTNTNNFPVLFSVFIDINNDLETSTTTLPNALFERILDDALSLLAPSFGINNGKLFFGFDKDVEHTLNIEHEPIDIGINLDASVNIKPITYELLSNGELILRLAEEVKNEILENINKLDPNDEADSQTLADVNIPTNFSELFVETFYSELTLIDFFTNMGLTTKLWVNPLFSRSLLTGSNQNGVIKAYQKGKRDDVAIKFSFQMTDIIAGSSRLEINVDTITAELYIVLLNKPISVPHPSHELRDDFIPIGALFPRFQFKVDVSRIDVELDLDDDLFGDNFVTNSIEFLGEVGLEAIASFLRDDFEGLAQDEGTRFLEENTLKIGELAASIMNQAANRDHLFQGLSTNDNHDWLIHTLNPAQLAVPFVQPDPIDHRFDDVDTNEEPVQPIDGPMPHDATRQLGKVTNLVFLMMENRSFDHMLGYLSHPNHGRRNDIDGLNGQAITVGGIFEGTTTTPQSSPRLQFSPNPGHSATTVAAQINDGAMDGFVSEFDRRIQADDEINRQGNLNDPFRILKFHTKEQVHTYEDLSKSALILDRWFCSIPGGTYPNRSCYYSGITPFMNNAEIFNDAGYLTDLTVFDVMDKKGIDWKIFESSVSFLRMFEKYRLEDNKIRPINELLNNSLPILPKVTFIDPDFKGSTGAPNDDHAPTNIKNGQQFIADIIKSLKRSPDWDTTMFVILYDEHGGFADHVPPPGTSSSDFPPDENGQATIRLAHPEAKSFGVRIPAIVVSPLVKAGSVGHKIYDHATVYKTILEKFMPEIKNSTIVPERVRGARHLGELIEELLSVNDVPDVLANPDIANTSPDEDESGGVSNPLSDILADNLAVGDNVLANPDITSDPTFNPTISNKPAAVIRHDSDESRPYNSTTEYKDFHEFITRLGHPIDKE